MSAVLEHTVLPPRGGSAELVHLAEVLRKTEALSQQPKLVGPDGSQLVLPDEIYKVLRSVVDAMSQGLAITIAPHHTLLTTQEAADLLSISRPTLVRLLEDGEIPFALRGRHRRIKLADVVEYQERVRVSRRATLDEMTQDAAEDGTYDTVDGFIETR
jgi:excisionase family DNA binding protein